ncbi:MAG: HD domain-containing protein [Actinomycetota bacterium]|nr:HD domain-containing protein [Actinomycetota bacterium]
MAYYETPYPIQARRKRLYGALLAAWGIGLISTAIVVQGIPQQVGLWLTFVVAFFVLEISAVEVNTRMVTSPVIAVTVTTGIVLGKDQVIGGIILMAALGLVQPRDFIERRIFQPAGNLGVVTTGAALTAVVLYALLPNDVANASLLRIVAVGAVAAAAGDFTSLVMTRGVVRQVFGSKLAGPWSNLGQILMVFVGLGAMGGLLGYAYVRYATSHGTTYNAMLVLVLGTLLIAHLFFASLAKLRVARESMLATLVKTLEAKDLYTRGHTERVAQFAVQLAQELKLSGDMQERIQHSALIHDLGKLAVPRELLKKRGRLTTNETQAMRDHVHHIDDLLTDVDWLNPLVEIASDHHAHFDGGGYHGSHSDHGATPSTESRVLAICDAFDAMTSNRPYRMALTQDEAFRELRQGSGTQFDPDMVNAFIEMIKRGGLTYGALVRMTDDEARQLAEERGWVFRD